eukprot:TRINITY_DN2042_c0_g1_i1.p1 TRINITY_DN2042_c0_g1~~TRINITY_DN2042_c0_g1_i1.p1  ORF type:complete len:100 (-),score=29.13 TRINITY_DN2042_c0_g1_i1:152-451(-)
MASRAADFEGQSPPVDERRLVKRLHVVQEYLEGYGAQGTVALVNVSTTTFTRAIDWLHGHLLQCIEQGMMDTRADDDSVPPLMEQEELSNAEKSLREVE